MVAASEGLGIRLRWATGTTSMDDAHATVRGKWEVTEECFMFDHRAISLP